MSIRRTSSHRAPFGPGRRTNLPPRAGRAVPVAPGARCPERSRWRCGAPAEHDETSPPSDHCRLALFVARAGPLLSGSRPHAADHAGREARRCHGGGPTRGDAVTDLPLIKAAKLWAKVSARTGATYLTGRWGGGRVLLFENLEDQ